jgi:hypothetical protein
LSITFLACCHQVSLEAKLSLLLHIIKNRGANNELKNGNLTKIKLLSSELRHNISIRLALNGKLKKVIYFKING